MSSNHQRDAKQEALDFLESLESDASVATNQKSVPGIQSKSSATTTMPFKAFNSSFNPSNPPPSSFTNATKKPSFTSFAANNHPRTPSPSTTPTHISEHSGGNSSPRNLAASPYRPPVAGFIPAGFSPKASIVPPSSQIDSNNNLNIHNSSNSIPNYTPPLNTLTIQSISNPDSLQPPPVSKPSVTGSNLSSLSSSKRVHAYVPGMKPEPAKSASVPGFAPSFPLGEPVLDQTQYNVPSSVNNNTQSYGNQQHESINESEDAGWSWGTSLWSTAQKGFANAKTFAGSAAQTLQQSETVKGLVKNYKPELEKLGNVIAPPLSFGSGEESNVKFLQGLTVWLCLSLPPSMVGERVLRMAKQSIRELWNGHLVPSHLGASVNFVDDTAASFCASVHQAVIKSEETMEKLQKLANGQIGETKHVLFTIQPFKTTLQSTMLETTEQIQFYCCMVCDVPLTQTANGSSFPPSNALIYTSCISQSITSTGVDQDWQSEMTSRVLETAVSDIVEDFANKILKLS